MNIIILNNSDNADPEFKTAGAAGFDIASNEDVVIPIGGSVIVKTGISMVIPDGYEGQLRLRSSMLNSDLIIPNAPGTIDCDYRGEVGIPLVNLNPHKPAHVRKGHRIAQIIIKKVPSVTLQVVSKEEFEGYACTARGLGGLGSTGLK